MYQKKLANITYPRINKIKFHTNSEKVPIAAVWFGVGSTWYNGDETNNPLNSHLDPHFIWRNVLAVLL